MSKYLLPVIVGSVFLLMLFGETVLIGFCMSVLSLIAMMDFGFEKSGTGFSVQSKVMLHQLFVFEGSCARWTPLFVGQLRDEWPN